MLIVENIHSYYDKSHVLEGVSLTVNPGELVTLLGRNGAGKTTTLRSILGIHLPAPGPDSTSTARRWSGGRSLKSPAKGWHWCRRTVGFSACSR